MNDTKVPDRGSVEYYAQHIRDQIAEGVDMYAYGFGYVTAFATSPVPPTDALQRIANIAAAVEVIEGEQRAAFENRDPSGLDYSRTDSEPDDPTPVSPARAPLHVGLMDDGGLVDLTLEPLHYLEPGNDGEDGDRVACGLTIGETAGYVGELDHADCADCIAAMAPISGSR